MADVVQGGNYASQAMVADVKPPTPPDPPPPSGKAVKTRPYFEPTGDIGVYAVLHFDSGKTQPQQMVRRNGHVFMFKGEGQWFDGRLMQDYEEWQSDGAGIHKFVDTSDAGNGGRDAYDLGGAVWLPSTVRVGSTYISTPSVTRFDRLNCNVHGSEPTTDYLYIRELIPEWSSPKNIEITFDDVLVVEWRKTTNLNSAPEETYYFAKNVGYVGWGGGGRDGAFIGELPGGREPLGGELTNCV